MTPSSTEPKDRIRQTEEDECKKVDYRLRQNMQEKDGASVL